MNNYDSVGLPINNLKENKENASLLNNKSTMGKFKEDIVNAVYQIEDKLANSTNSLENQFKLRNEVIDNRIIILEEQLAKLSKQLYDLNIKAEKASETSQIEKKNHELILTNEIRLNNLDKNLSASIYKYDKLFMENLVLPGQIGDFCKFKNVKECLDHILTQLILVNSFKEKTFAEIKSIKDKSDSSLKQIYLQIDQMKKSYISAVSLEIFEENMNNKFKNTNDYITEVQMENNKYAISLKDNSQLLQKDLVKLKEAKESMESYNNHLLTEFNDKIINTNEHFSYIKIQFNKISRQFTDLAEFIKDVRFKKNINSEVTKNDIRKLANNLFGDETTNGVTMNNVNESIQPIDIEQENFTENDFPPTVRNSKDSEQPKKSKFLLSSTSASMIHTAQNISLNLKKNKMPNKKNKNKKKKVYISAKPTNFSLNKLNNIKSRSADKKANSRLDFSPVLKTHYKPPNDLNLNDQFITKMQQAKLSKILTQKTYKPKNNDTNEDFTSN